MTPPARGAGVSTSTPFASSDALASLVHPKEPVRARLAQCPQWLLLQCPPLPHSLSKLHVPSGAVEHLPLLHFAPPPPQSLSKAQLDPALSAHLPPLHTTPAWQSDAKLHLP